MVQVDRFSFSIPSLGQLQALTLQSDGAGDNGSWRCDMVSVLDRGSGGTTYFLCDRWAVGTLQ